MHISELEESLYINTMMYELIITFSNCYDILFHSIDINQQCPYSSNWKQFVFTYLERFIFTGKSLKQLNEHTLEYNHTLQALKLKILRSYITGDEHRGRSKFLLIGQNCFLDTLGYTLITPSTQLEPSINHWILSHIFYFNLSQSATTSTLTRYS